MNGSTPTDPAAARIASVGAFNENLEPAQAVVIIPTYNERGNVEPLLTAICALGVPVDVLVADDGSPDGTADAVASHAGTLPRRILLMRRKGKFGLGVCYLDAFHWILEHAPHYRIIAQMDADFSHDPQSLPALVEAATAAGVSVGSRYVAGGSTPDWDRRRVLLSKGGNLYARTILKLFRPSYSVRDNTAGFIAWRRDVLEQVLDQKIFGDGYSFLTALKYAAFRLGYPPAEVPIAFPDRRLGVSKLNRHIIFEAFLMPWKLGFFFRVVKRVPSRHANPVGLHDNTPEMWDRYYASEDETGFFARLVHWAREVYFGGLFASRVVRLGGPATSYLEIGVGTAQTLARLQRMTQARCAGIEKTPRAYEIGKAYARDCEVVLGDGLSLPFADGSFDVVYSLGLLEHFEPAEQARLLREQARVAMKVLVEVPTASPHMKAITWFNRTILKKRGVWADEELFSHSHFEKKYPGLPFEYYFDWASGAMTCWFVLRSADILRHVGTL
ncbi:MAG TPA: glycosyltransferase [Candidatus Methylomirabilis sp.]|nr:glycosyltransferase [Candidatus Methylomirabilis sp.]